jgi:putative membrane protein
MFGISTLIMSASGKPQIPLQKKCKNIKFSFKGPFVGWISGMIVGLLPGVGSSQAGVISSQIMRVKMRDFLSALGGINTSNIIFTLIVLYSIGKTRSGLTVFISQFFDVNFGMILMVIPVAIISASFCALIVPRVGWVFLGIVQKINYSDIVKVIIVVISFLVVIFTGLYGVFVCIVGTFIGIFCIQMNIRRSYMMGFFMLTVILFFTGIETSLHALIGL